MTNEPPSQDGGAEQPLFLRVAAAVENDIIAGALAEGERVPSTNEIAAFARINPATALKGIAQLVADGIVEK
ncbi:MAG: GntR family transcriptional regulator, partial [Propioniciclava sp.]